VARAIILVLDSLGVGATPDAERFGDQNANTFGHIANWCAQGNLSEERNAGPLRIPNLSSLGLVKVNQLASGVSPTVAPWPGKIISHFAACQELSTGKDTPSGHWEMTGVPVRFDWGYFENKRNSFPEEFIKTFTTKIGVPAILGNCHSSGTEIINQLGVEHMETGLPICYTSADSVFQIAAHEQSFGLERLYQVCEIARELLDKYNIGRVIARPFIGKPGEFIRTGNRKDYTTPPHADTLLDHLVAAGCDVHSVGKIADIFAHRGITYSTKATGHDALFDATLTALDEAKPRSLIFTNFVEFDQSFGHRRNVAGYAAALEHFDRRLIEILDKLRADDLLILTADHGCDPTAPGTDHTREYVPFLAYLGKNNTPVNAGLRDSFCDIGQTVADFLEIEPLTEGKSLFS
jgi:phosphopentomutase